MTVSTTFEAPAELGSTLSEGARKELDLLGIDDRGRLRERPMQGIDPVAGRTPVPRRDIRAPEVLNEAYDYASAFSRGLRVDLGGATLLLLSGTASIDDQGRTLYPGDFRAQCLRTYRNLTALLAAENASWHDVVRTTCYLRDIERDYDTFNEIRTMFLRAVGMDPLPASTGIQARLCRSDLLVEIEAMAVVPLERAR
ncbi:MAG: Rid family hydrolase [Acidobacteriota bacterium]|jgi:enamine deaminase RidA (YjgF/YER057c/UK114 family)